MAVLVMIIIVLYHFYTVWTNDVSSPQSGLTPGPSPSRLAPPPADPGEREDEKASKEETVHRSGNDYHLPPRPPSHRSAPDIKAPPFLGDPAP
ncbi:hypothetical protein NHX12_020458 [Muraenolepis orangiensis]|uniref:Uncharacterized protein n=1 Tax=Muraenolepis orangiensis TaxID=630683 RepID=A0A9Q0EUW8_9TELE|nr:hypothetical protein NHX12_020458 [Muraenolepis orangiensis]